MIRICGICGKPFETQNKKKVTCSDECSEIRRKTHKYRRVCEVCGKPFENRNYRTRTCSAFCAHQLGHKSREIKPQEETSDNCMAKYHSKSLDEKAKKWGYDYGKKQGEETLEHVGKVDVNGILKELGVVR